MRKLSLVFVAAMLLATGNVLANDTTVENPTKSLSSQISEMLSENDFSENQTNLTAQVRFTLNTDGEIVVLSVNTEYEQMERFVKSKLNYQKVDLTNVEEGKVYTIPVRVKA
jgi:outer membrane lipopolysaccharide assembly protein LptE/RlpB